MLPAIYVYLIEPDCKNFGEPAGFSDFASINEAQARIPEGVYTTLRTFGQTKVIHLRDHFSRLEESAALLEKAIAIDGASVRKHLRTMIRRSNFSESRIRISVDLSTVQGRIYVILEPLKTPSFSDYENGIGVVTREIHRDHPKAKSTEFFHKAEMARSELNEQLHENEVVMLSPDGEYLEGLSSNFFAVVNGIIWTADEGVLSGFTRDIVLQVAKETGIPVNLHGYFCHDSGSIDEAFITSASRGILPVTSMDGKKVGNGKPGWITKKISEQVNHTIFGLLEEI